MNDETELSAFDETFHHSREPASVGLAGLHAELRSAADHLRPAPIG